MQWWRIAGSVLLLAVSCTSSVPGAGQAPDEGPSISETVKFTGTVVEFNGGAPIPSAQICVVDRPDIPCATSGTDGTYTVPIPVWTTGINLAFNATATGHIGFTWLLYEAPGKISWPAVQQLYDDATATNMMNHAGFAYPAGGKGFVLFSVYRRAGVTGMTVSSSPAGAGPVYMDQTGAPDPTLTGFTSDGYALLGNLEPGPIETTVSDTSCTQTFFNDGDYFEMWADAKAATIAGLTVADSITQMNMICP